MDSRIYSIGFSDGCSPASRARRLCAIFFPAHNFPKITSLIITAALKVLAGIKNKISAKEIREAIQTVGLDPDLKLPVKKYSLGMRQRLGLAQAIMENPSVLILDEPMNGLDKNGVEEIRKLLLFMKDESKIIVIASHNAEDIRVLCDEVHEMEQGELI